MWCQVKQRADGTVYEGYVNEYGLPDGRGTLIYADGAADEGYWKDDKLHGRGRAIQDDGYYFEGDISCDY